MIECSLFSLMNNIQNLEENLNGMKVEYFKRTEDIYSNGTLKITKLISVLDNLNTKIEDIDLSEIDLKNNNKETTASLIYRSPPDLNKNRISYSCKCDQTELINFNEQYQFLENFGFVKIKHVESDVKKYNNGNFALEIIKIKHIEALKEGDSEESKNEGATDEMINVTPTPGIYLIHLYVLANNVNEGEDILKKAELQFKGCVKFMKPPNSWFYS